MSLGSSLFWDVMRSILVVIYDVKDCSTLEDMTGQVVPKRRYITTNLRCVISWKGEDIRFSGANQRLLA